MIGGSFIYSSILCLAGAKLIEKSWKSGAYLLLGLYCIPFIAAWIMRNPNNKKDKAVQVETASKFKGEDDEIENDYN